MSSSSTILVFFLYGLSFFALGLTVTLQNKKFNKFLFANALPLLAAFGITHGITEWIDMFILVRKESIFYTADILDNVKLLFLILSFTFLLGFGFELFPSHSKLVKFIKWTIPPLLIVAWFIMYLNNLQNKQIYEIGEIWGRYLFGFPGAFLSSIGILHNVYKNRKRNHTKVYMRYILLSFSFLIYGIIAGFIVPEYPRFPASVFNYDNFLTFSHGIPVQLFRGIMAISIIVFTVESLTLNEADYRQINNTSFDKGKNLTFSGAFITETNVVTSQDEVIKLGRMLGHIINGAIIIVNKSYSVIYANKNSETITGLKKEALLHKNINNLHKNSLNLTYSDDIDPLVKTMKTGHNLKDIPISINQKDFLLSTYLLKSENGFHKWVVGVFRAC